jgi:hypothetical protein
MTNKNNIINNANNLCEENITNDSENSKEYLITDINNLNKDKDKDKDTNRNEKNNKNEKKINSTTLNTQRYAYTNNICNNFDDKIEWDNIKNEIIFELPYICYKMNYVSNEINDKNLNNKSNNISLSLYKNLSNIYNIIDLKILVEWDEIIEEIFNKIFSCNGSAEKNILYSLFHIFIFYFFFNKKREENRKIKKKIDYLYHNGGYKLSLNDLIIINLFQSLLNNDYIKSEENFSKCILLILLA